VGTVVSYVIIGFYFLTALVLMVYGLNCYLMVFLFQRGRKGAEIQRGHILNRYSHMKGTEHWPRVTTQIPVYNEYNVAPRVVRAVARMKYPKDKHEIQVLDDSNDKTRGLIDQVVHELQKEGYDVHVIRRKTRQGFKAGALAEGLNLARGELIAIFDADFEPPKDYLGSKNK